MEVNLHPDKGSEHIHIGSATLEAYENVETEETELWSYKFKTITLLSLSSACSL